MTERIDAHHHLWRLDRGDYGWLTPALEPIHRDFDVSDLQPILERHGIGRGVLVQAAPTEAETDFMLAVARENPVIAGVVGWTDFAAEDAADRIAARAEDPLMLSLRPMLQDLADDAWILEPAPRRALGALAATRLAFDALVKPRHLPFLVRAIDRAPELRVVIDHGGKPDIAHWRPGDTAFRDWTACLRVLAERGAFCKLSGLVTEAAPDWTVRELAPYVDVLLEIFGPSRLLWGSDWPVSILGGGYRRWAEATDALLAQAGDADRDAILGGTAAAFYRIGSRAP